MRITGIAAFARIEMAQKPLNVLCAMSEKEPPQGTHLTRGTFAFVCSL